MNLPITNTYRDVKFIPCKEKIRFVTVILVHENIDTYHLDLFLENNLDTDVYVIADTRPDVDGFGSRYKWKNNDVVLRDWWRTNKKNIKVDKIFYMEYDVLVLIKLEEYMFSKGVRSTNPFYFFSELSPNESWSKASWWWGEDGDKLPKKLKKKACNTMPVCIWINSKALNCLISPMWDKVYSSDIVADIRFATILNYKNILLEDCSNIDINLQVSCHLKDIEDNVEVIKQIKNKFPGIYHPVKRLIDQF